MNISLDRITARVVEISGFKTGWLNGEGESFRKLKEKIPYVSQGIVKMSDALALNPKYTELDGPFIFPTPEGNLQIEYGDDRIAIEVEYNIEKDTIEVEVFKY